MGAARKDQWILIVDDDPDIRELLVDDLIDQFDGDLRIVEAADGMQASGKLDNQVFDCIITDLKMPKRDGDHFIEWVRESNLNKHVPIVVVTGYPEPHLLDKYPNIHFLPKPVDFATFGQTVKTQLKLGRLDKRISADLFNATVDATRRFFGKVLEVIPTVDKPAAKERGGLIEGEIFNYVSVKGPFGICDIVIGYQKDVLDRVAPNSDKNYEKLSMAATSTITNLMLNTYHSQNANQRPPKVEEKCQLLPNSDLYSRLAQSTGLKVPVTIYGNAVVLTMINKK